MNKNFGSTLELSPEILRTAEEEGVDVEDMEDVLNNKTFYISKARRWRKQLIEVYQNSIDSVVFAYELLGYWFDDFLQQPGSSAMFLLLLMIFSILVGSALLEIAHPLSTQRDNLFLAWKMIVDPSTHFEEYQLGMTAFIVSVIICIAGLVIMGLIIGFLSDTVGSKMDDLRQGNGKIVERNHFLVLGWSEKVLDFLVSCSKSKASASVVVVLSQVDKEIMDREIKNLILSRTNRLKIIVKNGNPLNLQELQRVSVSRARCIIVVSNDDLGDRADSNTVMTVVAVLGTPRLKGFVVAELQSKDKMEAIVKIGGPRVVPILAPEFVGRFISQCGRQEGLSTVFYDVLDFEGNEFYFKKWPKLVGKPFKDLFDHQDEKATICGVMQAHQSAETLFSFRHSDLLLNPPDDYILRPDDQIVVLAEDHNTYRFYNKPSAKRPMQSVSSWFIGEKKPKKILIIGLRHNINSVLSEMYAQVTPGSSITFLSTASVESRHIVPPQDETVQIEHVVGDARSPIVLTPLLERRPFFDSIFIFSDSGNNYGPEEKDMPDNDVATITLTLCQMLDDYRTKAKKQEATLERIHVITPSIAQDLDPLIISEISNVEKMKLISSFQKRKSEWIVANQLLGIVLSMLATDYNSQGLITELFTHDGNDLYLIDHRHLIQPDKFVSFNEIWLRGRQMNPPVIVLGYMKKDKKPIINPRHKNRKLKYKQGDCFIVLAPSELSEKF
jgi:Trk K+ transport system NAD-binding subunit